IVVPEDFDGRLQWQVKFAGRTGTTTEKVLNPLYELEPNSERRLMAGVDIKTAPKRWCVQRPPPVSVIRARADPVTSAETIPTMSAQIGAPLVLNGDVQDDGLPRDSKLIVNWRKTSGAGSVMFSNTDAASTRATFGMPGEYELELTANDGEKSNSVKVR